MNTGAGAGTAGQSTFDSAGGSSPRPRDANGRPSMTPVATRVDRDEVQGNAWNNESSVRHVQDEGGWGGFTENGNESRESLRRGMGTDKKRALGVT